MTGKCDFDGIKSLPTQTNDSNVLNALDCISRQAAIDSLLKALYEYEDKTEKQFLESDDLDIGDWIGHRIFVQNMSDIDRQTILNLPSAEPIIRCKDCEYHRYDNGLPYCNKIDYGYGWEDDDYCSRAERRTDG